MYFPVERKANECNKLEHTILAGASFIELLRRQRDAVGLSIFNEEIEIHTKAKSSATHHRTLYIEMEKRLKEVDFSNKKTNAIKAIHDIAALTHQRSLVFIFSDMMDSEKDNQEMMQALQHLRHKKHEVVLFHVHDKKMELDFDLENRPYNFVDLETGEKMKLSPSQIKDSYKESMDEWYKDVKLKCGQIGVDFVPLNIREPLELVLVQYLIKRQKVVR